MFARTTIHDGLASSFSLWKWWSLHLCIRPLLDWFFEGPRADRYSTPNICTVLNLWTSCGKPFSSLTPFQSKPLPAIIGATRLWHYCMHDWSLYVKNENPSLFLSSLWLLLPKKHRISSSPHDFLFRKSSMLSCLFSSRHTVLFTSITSMKHLYNIVIICLKSEFLAVHFCRSSRKKVKFESRFLFYTDFEVVGWRAEGVRVYFIHLNANAVFVK